RGHVLRYRGGAGEHPGLPRPQEGEAPRRTAVGVTRRRHIAEPGPASEPHALASVYDLKPRFQGILRPMVGGLVAAGITPNQVTVAAVAGSIAVGAAVTQAGRLRALLLLLPLWLLARLALNAIHGMMAREHGLATRAGAVLNELGDVVSDLALYL